MRKGRRRGELRGKNGNWVGEWGRKEYNYALKGCGDDDQKTMENKPYGYKNTLIMRSSFEYSE